MNKLYKQIATLGFGCFLSAVGYSTVRNFPSADHSALRLRPYPYTYWSTEEDAILQEKVLEHGNNWNVIATFLPGRTPEGCRCKWNELHPETRHNHTRWSSEEDDQLRQLVTQHGAANWPLIASFVTGRTARRCQERWDNYLAPGINLSPWTLNEDALLQQKHREFGPKWTRIATFFLDRTDIHCKNRWHILKRHNKKAQPVPPSVSQLAQQQEKDPLYSLSIPYLLN